MSHPFEVGRTYRNRDGDYEVVVLNGPNMVIRYSSGRQLETTVKLQARIWKNIQAEEKAQWRHRTKSSTVTPSAGLNRTPIPPDLGTSADAWGELSPKNWARALAVAAESEPEVPFPEVQPQADLLRLFVAKRDFPSSLSQSWPSLPEDVRVMSMALIVREGIQWPQARTIKQGEESAHIRLLIDLIMDSRESPADRQRAFSHFNEALKDLVVEEAWNSDRHIDFTPLLPRCAYGTYVHCEGQDWEKLRQEGVVWCRQGPCKRARMTADMTLPLNQWSLPEFLNALRLDTSRAVKNPREYVTKLGGWINRLNDIRTRLKCSCCSQFMEPDGAYSRNLARYHVTVVRCRNDECPQYGKGVYLSHCWACHQPIDSSRETPIQVEERYLCAHCGSGPQSSNTYSQGDVCPDCGSLEMLQQHDERYYVCQDCGHGIKSPPQWAITGARSGGAGLRGQRGESP